MRVMGLGTAYFHARSLDHKKPAEQLMDSGAAKWSSSLQLLFSEETQIQQLQQFGWTDLVVTFWLSTFTEAAYFSAW